MRSYNPYNPFPRRPPSQSTLSLSADGLSLTPGVEYLVNVNATSCHSSHMMVATAVLCDPTEPAIAGSPVLSAPGDRSVLSVNGTAHVGWSGVFGDNESLLYSFDVCLACPQSATCSMGWRDAGSMHAHIDTSHACTHAMG